MDRQKCQIRIVSYAYIESQTNITWFTNEPIRYNPKVNRVFCLKNELLLKKIWNVSKLRDIYQKFRLKRIDNCLAIGKDASERRCHKIG